MAIIQANDCRSDFGRNINNICRDSNNLAFSNVNKGDIKYFPIKDNEKWRVSILKQLLYNNKLSLPPNEDEIVYLNEDEFNFLLDFVACT